MFEMLTQKCRICGGYTNTLLVGDRCIACAYTPAGRPIGNGGWDAGAPLPEPDWARLLAAAGVSDEPDEGDERPRRPVVTPTAKRVYTP